MISVYDMKTEVDLTERRIEMIESFLPLLDMGRRNPVAFAEKVWGIRLMDFQKYALMGAWQTNVAVWLMSRNSGKTFLSSIYIMLRCVLFPGTKVYIIAKSSDQANETFGKLKDLIKGNLHTMQYNWQAMYAEIVVPAATDGFTREGEGYKCVFYNGSTVISLPGNAKTIRGKRADLVIYDEASFIDDEVFQATQAFTAQDANFKTAQKGVDVTVIPQSLPKQRIYMSSAGDINSKMFEMYAFCAKQMLVGSNEYFCCDLNYEIPANPTLDGQKYRPLLDQKTIDAERANPYTFEREFLNRFADDTSDDAAVKRDAITRNEKVYLPVLENRGDKKVIYGLFYDSALLFDNSFVLVGEFWKDEKIGWRARIVNGVNLLSYTETTAQGKRIMRTDEQIDFIRKMMVTYNGDNPEYANLHLFMDPGGLGATISDFLCKNYIDEWGKEHYGVVDPNYEHSAELMGSYPLAKTETLEMLNAVRYKTDMFAEASDMINRNLIEFPMAPSSQGKIYIDGEEILLTEEERRALIEIEATKTEFLNIRKMTSPSGKTVYGLPNTLKRKMHDDRAYCLAAFGYYLAKLRHIDDIENGRIAHDLKILVDPTRTENIKRRNEIRNPFAKQRYTQQYMNRFKRLK